MREALRKRKLLISLLVSILNAQVPPSCELSTIISPSPYYFDQLEFRNVLANNIYFVFDSYTKYLSGVEYYGAIKLWVIADTTSSGVGPQHGWNLHIHLDNEVPPNNTEWKEEFPYIGVGNLPRLDTLKIRVRSPCNQVATNGWTSISNKSLGDIAIITTNTPWNCAQDWQATPPTCGSTMYNRQGSYTLPAVGSFFTFFVDLKIGPINVTQAKLKPGIYSVILKSCLFQTPCP